MNDFHKVVEELQINFVSAKTARLEKPISIEQYVSPHDTFIFLKKGDIFYGKDYTPIEVNTIFFIPAKEKISLHFGKIDDVITITNEEYSRNHNRYQPATTDTNYDFAIIKIDAQMQDSIGVFTLLEIPPYVIEETDKFMQLFDAIIKEQKEGFLGQKRYLNVLSELVMMNVLRYLLNKNIFTEKLGTNISFFKDARLIKIFFYIKEHLSADLSNKVLANIAQVSEEYLGQYIKTQIGINPQDYIEYQRMKKAVELLSIEKYSVKQVGIDVGYKDTAYFCRRFRILFGVPAGKMKKRLLLKANIYSAIDYEEADM